MNKTEEQISKLDEELVNIIKDFIFLSSISWSKNTMKDFLTNVEKENFKLPKVSYPTPDYKDKIDTLKKYIEKLGKDESPAIFFLRETAQSYLDAYMIIQGVGTNDVTEFSRKLYGSPNDLLMGYKRKGISIAKYFLRVTDEYKKTIENDPLIYSAGQFKKELSRLIRAKIDQQKDPIDIRVDSQIAARAAAGADYVKIRKNAMFSKNDLEQLFYHEVMVHTLTFINGRKQPYLKTLGYNSPRTTATQEGIAVYAEYINVSIELVRLKRIALRIIAIDMAERGANFIDLFRFYKKSGQNNEESYYSAMRIFRGGNPEGGIIFYKDNVYLSGLIEVSSFLKHAMHEGMLHDIDLLFCGKLTTSDVTLLKPLSDSGFIADPAYVPDWAKKSSQLAAHLAFNDLTERFKIPPAA
jgi:uncharacterized protein (TIGR02421 family)